MTIVFLILKHLSIDIIEALTIGSV